MKFNFVNNDDAGIKEEVTAAADTTVSAYLNLRLGNNWESDYTPRLNREPVTDSATYIPEGGTLTVTHKKQDGGC